MIAAGVVLAGLLAAPCQAGSETVLSIGQAVYVPVYSHIYSGDREQPVYLAVTLSIRNTDMKGPIIVESVDYYDSRGIRVKKYIEGPIQVKPMAAIRYVVPESDKVGGSGASFLVHWKSRNRVNPPRIEAVMISTRMQQGISFVSGGQVIAEKAR